MTLYSANLFLKDLVPKTRFKFALPQRRSRDLHRFLTTTY
jgi:hypothetical protein